MSRTIFIPLASALCLVLIGIFTNVWTSNLPPWIDPIKAHAFPALVVTVVLMLVLLWQADRSPVAVAAIWDKKQLKRNRRQMLARVRHDWIEGVLKQSLYQLARIELGLEARPDAVERPITLVVQEAAKSPQVLPWEPACAVFLILTTQPADFSFWARRVQGKRHSCSNQLTNYSTVPAKMNYSRFR